MTVVVTKRVGQTRSYKAGQESSLCGIALNGSKGSHDDHQGYIHPQITQKVPKRGDSFDGGWLLMAYVVEKEGRALYNKVHICVIELCAESG